MKKRVKRHAVVQPLDQSIKLIALTQGQNAIVDAVDYEWLNQWNWFAHWNPPTRSFYAGRSDHGKVTIIMHRIILGCSTRREEGDHKNNDTLDNRRDNLRKCVRLYNARNKRKGKNNTSGFKGVSWHYNRWESRIMVNNVPFRIGGYKTAEDAARAYDEAAKRLHGEFAHLNFPLEN